MTSKESSLEDMLLDIPKYLTDVPWAEYACRKAIQDIEQQRHEIKGLREYIVQLEAAIVSLEHTVKMRGSE